MIKILDEVIMQRQMRNDNNMTIRLSEVFMKAALKSMKDFNENSYIMKNPIDYGSMSEFFYKNYKVINREYRDDTNDPDVEETILKLFKKQ